jgi:hypothetical protein
MAPDEEKILTVVDLDPAGSNFFLINNADIMGKSIEISLIRYPSLFAA